MKWIKAEAVAVLTTLVWALGACDGPVRPAPELAELGDAERRNLYERSDETFARAQLFRPAGELTGNEIDLAPLLLQQIDAAGNVTEAPTVYLLQSTVEIHGHGYPQRTYVWWYPTLGQGEGASQAQGIRVTFARDGFPVIYEVMTDTSEARLIFVAESLEEAASEAFGPPPPGRRFSIEHPVPDAPGVIVAGVLASGPTPLGPFVYLASGSGDVATVICRCMSSQVDVVTRTVEYQLVSDGDGQWREETRWSWPGGAGALERWLRLPPASF